MSHKASLSDIAVRCHEIQTGLGRTEVPEFEQIVLIGMAVRLALHIRGLPAIPFEIVKLVASHYLQISSVAIRHVLELLEEIEFVRLGKSGKTIKNVLPDVPYYEELYSTLGKYTNDLTFSEAEQLSIELVQRLSVSPHKLDTIRNELGAESKLLDRVLKIGTEGSYIRRLRARGKDVILTPTHFSENPELLADVVASGNAMQLKKLFEAIRQVQGYPLALVEQESKLGSTSLTPEESRLVVRLAQDGFVKPPKLTTKHAGENFFLFTPTPSGAALASTKRDIYERAMAIVAAIRQGQFLPREYAIRSPGAVLYTLRHNLKLKRATTEAAQQYQNLVYLRIATLNDAGHGYKQLEIIDTEENKEALDIAYDLVNAGTASGIEVDEEARRALQKGYSYTESLISSGDLKKNKQVQLSQEQHQQLEMFLLQSE